MNREEILKEMKETFSPIFRMFEYDECMFYQLIELLGSKGIITREDYDKYLSNGAIKAKMEKVNKALEEEDNK